MERIRFDGSASSHLPEIDRGSRQFSLSIQHHDFDPLIRVERRSVECDEYRPPYNRLPSAKHRRGTRQRRPCRLGARSESGKSFDMRRLHAATARQHKLHLIRRHCYEGVERVEAHFNEQVDLIGCTLQDFGRILLENMRRPLRAFISAASSTRWKGVMTSIQSIGGCATRTR